MAANNDDIKQQLCRFIAKDNISKISEWLKNYKSLVNEVIEGGNTPLHFAIRWNYIQAVALLLENGADVNLPDRNDGRTPLHLAILMNRIKIAELLLQKGADVILRDENGRTPLHTAVSEYSLGMMGEDRKISINEVKLLVENKADIFALDNEGNTALHYAVWVGHTAIVAFLLDKSNPPNLNLDQPNQSNFNMVTWFKGVIQYLSVKDPNDSIEIEASPAPVKVDMDYVNKPNEKGETPLSIAAECGHIAIVKLLLARGANANPGDKKRLLNGIMKQSHIEGDYIEMLNFLIQGADGENNRDILFTDAAKEGKIELVKLLIEKGADAKKREPIYWAVERGHIVIIKILLGRAANIAHVNKEALLYYAAKEGDVGLVTLALQHGANPNQARKASGVVTTPLYIAIDKKHTRVVATLLAWGADVNQANEYGTTPLHKSMYGGSKEIINLLVTHPNIKINPIDNEGYIPLYKAIRARDTETVQLLIEWGADVDFADEDGWTLLHHAVQQNSVGIARLLLDSGADADKADNEKQTARDLGYMNFEMLRLFKEYPKERIENNLKRRKMHILSRAREKEIPTYTSCLQWLPQKVYEDVLNISGLRTFFSPPTGPGETQPASLAAELRKAGQS